MKLLSDNHMHTSFSGDCSFAPEVMITTARKKALSGITLTDHLDWDYPDDPDLFALDLDAYYDFLEKASSAYSDEAFTVRKGIELGLQPHLCERLHALTTQYDFDYIIGSTHVIHGQDPYYSAFFHGKTEQEAFSEYYNSILENIRAFSDFDAIGHLDYGFRYQTYRSVIDDTYTPYREIVDEILRFIIRKDIALEINMSGFHYGLSEPHPSHSIIRRYKELGGELITIGADAHKPDDIALGFSVLPALLRDCGFDTFAVYENRKPRLCPLFTAK